MIKLSTLRREKEQIKPQQAEDNKEEDQKKWVENRQKIKKKINVTKIWSFRGKKRPLTIILARLRQKERRKKFPVSEMEEVVSLQILQIGKGNIMNNFLPINVLIYVKWINSLKDKKYKNWFKKKREILIVLCLFKKLNL